MGNAAYDERRRLEAESALLQEQKYNARMKREAAVDESLDLIHASVKAFFSGRGRLVISKGVTGDTEVRFSPDPIE